jgi:hypothetical protein
VHHLVGEGPAPGDDPDLPREGQVGWHDPELARAGAEEARAVGADQADLRNTDAFIDSKFVCADKFLLFTRTDGQPVAGFFAG